MSGTLENACNERVRNFIIVGQTGIGVHHFLHIFFLPSADITHQGRFFPFTTFLQCVWPSVSQRHASDYVWLFDESGVRPFASKIPWDGIQDLSKNHTAWALVDSNLGVQNPAPLLFEFDSPFFIVGACSPHRHRWAWVKYHGKTQFFYTNPFSLEEILRGAYIHLFCKIMSSHSHCMKGIWFNPVIQ